jgi:hypothetical protein
MTKNHGVALHMMLPDGSCVPANFHVTEMGIVSKRFVDCGGTQRKSESCVLQVWVADDFDHRLKSDKLDSIVQTSRSLLGLMDKTYGSLPVEIEFENEVISQYPLGDVEVTPNGLLFVLGKKHTACLAPDKCGVGGCC